MRSLDNPSCLCGASPEGCSKAARWAMAASDDQACCSISARSRCGFIASARLA